MTLKKEKTYVSIFGELKAEEDNQDRNSHSRIKSSGQDICIKNRHLTLGHLELCSNNAIIELTVVLSPPGEMTPRIETWMSAIYR